MKIICNWFWILNTIAQIFWVHQSQRLKKQSYSADGLTNFQPRILNSHAFCNRPNCFDKRIQKINKQGSLLLVENFVKIHNSGGSNNQFQNYYNPVFSEIWQTLTYNFSYFAVPFSVANEIHNTSSRATAIWAMWPKVAVLAQSATNLSTPSQFQKMIW